MIFGAKAPFQISELPSSRFRRDLDSLPRASKRRAVEWLHSITFTDQDVSFLHVDSAGGIFYADTILPADPPQEELLFGNPSGYSNKLQNSTSSPLKPSARPGPLSPEGIGQFALPENITPATVFTLHTRPGSSNVVFLDFDGHVIQDTAWNETTNPLIAQGFDTDNDPLSYSTEEAEKIFDIWLRVAEDLAPFDIDVTTEEPGNFTNTTGRVLITRNVDANGADMPFKTAGGVAYVNVWGRSDYAYHSPAFVYYDNLGNGYAKYVGEASSHELGHNLGLTHDGTSTDPYYFGHGDGPTSWAPIMGASYSKEMTHWSKGEYPGANQPQDDIAIIAGKLTFRPDDRGNTPASASPLQIEDSGEVLASDPESDPGNLSPANKGIIERTSDVDVFYFDADNGELNLTVAPVPPQLTANLGVGNLDIKATLYDELNTPIVESFPEENATATLLSIIAPGRYYLEIASDGDASVPYSNYGSLGQYFITGTVPIPPRDTVAPEPNPMTFSSPPTATSDDSMTMTATSATDDSGGTVWYYFECTSTGQPGCGNSGWRTNPTYTASGLAPSSEYGFRVKARDSAENETGWSEISSATTASSQIHINDVALALKQAGRRQVYAQATVVIRDSGGLAIPSAEVQITWSGAVAGNETGTTDTNGKVVFESDPLDRYPDTEFRMVVDSVSHTAFTYDAAANVDDDACIITMRRHNYRSCN